MRFETPFPASERIPDVPARLAACIERYLARTERIEILACSENGWETINTLYMEGEGAGEEELVGALVTACVEQHANTIGRGGKYRAVLKRRVGVEWERRRATFPVDVETAEQRERKRRLRWTGKAWPDITLASMQLLEVAAEYQHRTMDRVLEQQRIEAHEAKQLRALMLDLTMLYEDGLRMQTEASREAVELRVRRKLEDARAQFDATLWDALAPAIEVALAQIREAIEQSLATGRGSDAGEDPCAVGPPGGCGGERFAERKEGAPPSSGDAPSPGKVPSDS